MSNLCNLCQCDKLDKHSDGRQVRQILRSLVVNIDYLLPWATERVVYSKCQPWPPSQTISSLFAWQASVCRTPIRIFRVIAGFPTRWRRLCRRRNNLECLDVRRSSRSTRALGTALLSKPTGSESSSASQELAASSQILANDPTPQFSSFLACPLHPHAFYWTCLEFLNLAPCTIKACRLGIFEASATMNCSSQIKRIYIHWRLSKR